MNPGSEGRRFREREDGSECGEDGPSSRGSGLTLLARRFGDQPNRGNASLATMKRPLAIDRVVENEHAVGRPIARRDPQDRRMPTLRTAKSQTVAVEQFMDRGRQLPILVEVAKGSPGQLGKLVLDRQTNRPLQTMELPLQLVHRLVGFTGSDRGAAGHVGSAIRSNARAIRDASKRNVNKVTAVVDAFSENDLWTSLYKLYNMSRREAKWRLRRASRTTNVEHPEQPMSSIPNNQYRLPGRATNPAFAPRSTWRQSADFTTVVLITPHATTLPCLKRP